MVKKIVSLLLVFSILFAFASCKKKSEQEDGSESVIQNGQVVTDEKNGSASDNSAQQGSDNQKESQTVKVTIPEGYTLVRISWLLEDKGLCTSEEFIEAAQTYKEWLDVSKYPFLQDLGSAPNVCFYLEGYFFPLTYEIPSGADAKEIIQMFLNGTKQKFNESFMAKVRQSGFNLHEILTMASLIEKEAYSNEQRVLVSSVLHNRLKAGMKFQCDPTINYCTGVIEPIYPDKIDYFKYYYNTNRCSGLMAGPICNPGMASIEAAISPAQTDYLFFIIGTVEPYESYFSSTYEEHSKYWAENKDRLTGAEQNAQ